MSAWQQWRRRPQTVWWRRVSFQVHLWTGIGLSLYVVMLSLTGSLLVYRVELSRALDVQRPKFNPSAQPLSAEALRAAAARTFPDHTVTHVDTRMSRRDPTVEIGIERDGVRRRRAFDPYTGKDLGDWFPIGVQAVIWVADLHDDLLLARRHRVVNGIGSILVTVLVLTGAVVWWPGIRTWRRALTVKWVASWPRLNWDLHSASGFWLYLLILNWSITGIYLAFPAPFTHALEYVLPASTGPRFSWTEETLMWLTRIHFGRWPNPLLKALWCLMGLVPCILSVTGLVMWWNRVLRQYVTSRGAARQVAAVHGAAALAPSPAHSHGRANAVIDPVRS